MIFGPSTWNQSYALTGGPSQPEVQSFEPIGTSDMVDLFSGDFTYNIPLLDVEGYPINLAYHSGVTMDQEASWVGLGWNVNVGVINRSLRGLPDDFKGDEVTTKLNIKPDITAGVDYKMADIELWGKEDTALVHLFSSVLTVITGQTNLNMNFNVGLNYNNYNGMGFDIGLGLGVSKTSKLTGFTGTASLGLNSSSAGGLSVNPSLSYSDKMTKAERLNTIGGSVSGSFNSRQGLTYLSVGNNTTFKGSKSVEKVQKGMNMSGGRSFDLMQSTYTPKITQSMRSFAVSGRLKVGPEFPSGVHPSFSLGANYTQQYLPKSEKNKTTPSYGYLYSEYGQNNDEARMDFNRENEGSVTPSTPNLALTNYTYDIYSVSGQGVGGSYRPYRGQIGYVFNNKATNKSVAVPFTIEAGAGAWGKLGGQLGVNVVDAESGAWRGDSFRFKGENKAYKELSFKQTGGKDFEKVFFKEANEMSVNSDEGLYNEYGGDEPVRLKLDEKSKYNVEVLPQLIHGTNQYTTTSITRNELNARAKRNNTIQDLTVGEMKSHFGVNDFISGSYAANGGENHHLGQIVSLGTDGMRYVYGQPAYNTLQKEVSFAVGRDVDGNDYDETISYAAGLVEYDPGSDNDTTNKWGLNHYFQSVETPGFAHSFLLTSVLSDDYVDVDGIKGPSDGDLGSYTKFSYARVDNYKWRVPVEQNTATYNEGLKGDPHDDMASYLYGEKELWYLDSIETKNFVAVFHTIDRKDAFGVLGENGGKDTTKPMQALDKISLFSKEDIRLYGQDATPLKEVHFVYDYELCPGIPNSSTSQGKLTLKKVYFTYRDSQKGKLSPYSFSYDNNYSYDLKAYDRWGNYMPNDVTTGNFNDTILATFEYPYTNQDPSLTKDYSTAWTLGEVSLPSGGSIKIDYEPDDYAYVQDKQAMNMVKIVNVGKDTLSTQIPDNQSYKPTAYTGDYNVKPISDKTSDYDGDHKNRRIYFYIDPELGVEPYVAGMEDLYFKCLMEFDTPTLGYDGRYDFVSGYAEIQEYGVDPSIDSLAYILLKPVSFNDVDFLNDDDYNPIALAGIQFGRLYLSRYVWDSPSFNQDQTFGGAMINSLFQTFANFVEGFKNPNKTIYDKNRGTKIVLEKSWIRLNNVNGQKLGGGSRVSSISMNDNWADMTADQMDSFDYGQDYSYTLKDGSSSGVASYEPQLGGEENPFKQPVYHSDDKLFAPDERFFQEAPFGESFFPSASVGYSRVVVKNKQREDVVKNATGSVVHEFFTAKDFPTKVAKTDLEKIQNKSNPFGLRALFKVESNDFMTASQGFVVETNDMHGKPKSQSVYQEKQNEPITKVEYVYLGMEGSSMATGEVENMVTVINNDGSSDTKMIGVHYDVVADFQESTNRVYDAGLDLNVDVAPAGPIPLPVPTIWPKFSSEKTMFRSATMTKVVQKFGILESTIATDLGSTVETKNLAYDAETGQVLLTETTTNYDDKVYSMNFPAYWYYDNMGPAYENIGYNLVDAGNSIQITDGKVVTPNAKYFVEGDELAVLIGSAPVKAWVTEVSGNEITMINKWGNPLDGIATKIEVIRSGRRNMQSQMMASITTLTNPLENLQNNHFSNVLQASAIEFSDEWRTYCDCNGTIAAASSNPYFLGAKGNYRPIVSYLHLSDRTQSDVNDNTNLRKDGVFKSFTPYYNLNSGGKWYVDRKDWTYTAEVTEFNPYGQELANEDALGRESAAQFGFNQTLAKAVAANAGYRDIGFSSFEDDDFSDCADNHFKFSETDQRVSTESHTGKYSIQVTSTNSATLRKELARCVPTPCNVSVTYTEGTNSISPEASGGSGEYAYSFEVLSGNPVISMTNDGPIVAAFPTSTYKMEFIVTDSEGCKTVSYLTVEDGEIVNE
jgi:hypothetical protein